MSLNPVNTVCRSCRYYTPEGRRGGHCQQLGVSVRGGWKACSLAVAAFTPVTEDLEVMWQKEVLKLREVLPVESCQLDSTELESTPTLVSIEARGIKGDAARLR